MQPGQWLSIDMGVLSSFWTCNMSRGPAQKPPSWCQCYMLSNPRTRSLKQVHHDRPCLVPTLLLNIVQFESLYRLCLGRTLPLSWSAACNMSTGIREPRPCKGRMQPCFAEITSTAVTYKSYLIDRV